jgi:ribosomal peptide maturation radical SAM protein 1
VGVTTTFDQTSAAVALLDRIKAAAPLVRTVIGGANCEGEMAVGVRSLSERVDTVCSGEAEGVFADLVGRCVRGEPIEPVVHGAPCTDLDALPTPRFDAYFSALGDTLGDVPTWVLFETSRGCWWGAKQHCTFCGLNGSGMGFRHKSPDRVIEQLREVLAASPTVRVCMADNIMPHAYHRTLVPRLAAEVGPIRLFYEQKANLRLSQVRGLREAGCVSIQPGIEALDSSLLARMRKGVLARQNLALLRYGRSVGMLLKWALLWGFPGDERASYERTLQLLPLLHHLPPPQASAPLHLDRFSPYVEQPGEHGVSDLQPLPAYEAAFPEHADLASLAYHLHGRFDSGSRNDRPLVDALASEVARWKQSWEGPPPDLHVVQHGAAGFRLVDTRRVATARVRMLDRARAHAALVGRPWHKSPLGPWAVRNHLAVHLDGWCVPLATASPALLAQFEDDRSAQGESVQLVG